MGPHVTSTIAIVTSIHAPMASIKYIGLILVQLEQPAVITLIQASSNVTNHSVELSKNKAIT